MRSLRLPQSSPGATALVFAVAVAVYAPSLAGNFVWDDWFFVRDNEFIRSWSHAPAYFVDKTTMASTDPIYVAYDPQIYRPIRNLSYLIDHTIWRLNPFGFHLQNLLLHGLCSALVFSLAQSMMGDRRAALFAALTFAVHPALSEAVAWIKCRDTLLSAFFLLAAARVWSGAIQAGAASGRRIAGILALYVLALLSYLTAAGALIAFPAMQWMRDGRRRVAGAVWLYALMLALTAAFVAGRAAVLGQTAQWRYFVDGQFLPTMITMIPVAARYVELLFVPLRLNADYAAFPQYRSFLAAPVLLAFALLAMLAVAWALAIRRREWPVGVGFVWIAAFLAPVSNIVPTMQLLAERFLYLPAFGAALLFGRAAQKLGARAGGRRTTTAILIGLLLVFSVRTLARLPVWWSDMRLYKTTYFASPDNVRMAENYVFELMNAGRPAEALPIAEELHAGGDRTQKLLRAYGRALAAVGRIPAAMEIFAEGRQRFPAEPEFWIDAALIASRSGMKSDALALILEADLRFIADWDLRARIAFVMFDVGLLDEARALFMQMAEEKPDEAGPWLHLARIARQQGDRDAANQYYEEALKRDPQNAEAMTELGVSRDSE